MTRRKGILVGLAFGVTSALLALAVVGVIQIFYNAGHIAKLAADGRAQSAANSLALCKVKAYEIAFAEETKRTRGDRHGTSYSPQFVRLINRTLPLIRSIPAAKYCPAVPSLPAERTARRAAARTANAAAVATGNGASIPIAVPVPPPAAGAGHSTPPPAGRPRGPRGPRGPQGPSPPSPQPAATPTPVATPAPPPPPQGPLGLPCVLGILCH